ncbi:GlxA family transcriptional regulator [Longispora albida]|uniref:GlxA family transcriptional regulator n=1 Tax=Longispora albida TaxID=203523 RepID=UPI000363FCEC|nr:helix-turn-helix domain-containing protein [Longispora albida]
MNAREPEDLATHRIAVIAVPPVFTFDLAVPELIFGAVVHHGRPRYEIRVCAAEPGPIASFGSTGLTARHGLEIVAEADTVLVTGKGSQTFVDEAVLEALRAAAAAGTRIASMCTGAFALAAAGLLDGRGATAHWQTTAELSSRYPQVDVRPDVLYVEDGPIFSSAGVAAAIDLCLHLVRSDHGAAVANEVARAAVVAPVRHGGQAQFVESALPPERGTTLAPTRAWALTRLGEPISLTDLARHANISLRTLTRRFKAETGLSPLRWLLAQRVERARELLETTSLPMDQVARHAGLGSADSLRDHLRRHVRLTPSAYRSAFTRA